MKRTYISPEFGYRDVYGTFTMESDGAFFGSVMMRLEENIEIINDNLTYNQLLSGEQLSETNEINLPQIIYDATYNKEYNHTLTLDLNQTEFQKENSARWQMRIELRDILRNHLFAVLKNARTFEGVKSEYTSFGNVDQAIFDYINKNLIYRYAFKEMSLFIDFVDLCNDDTLQYQNNFDPTLTNEKLKIKNFEQTLSTGEEFLNISFSQSKPAYNFSYRYNFDLKFEKL
jgi:hypothetical protein